jgi:hypothetical protein
MGIMCATNLTRKMGTFSFSFHDIIEFSFSPNLWGELTSRLTASNMCRMWQLLVVLIGNYS